MTTRVVIVEDAPDVREMLITVLAMHDFEVVGEARDGSEAAGVVEATDPDIVVMDYMMPEVNGLEATRRIRATRPDQRVILYSAYLDGKLRAEAVDAGVAVCVPKGAGVEELVREISAAAVELGD
ncbi:MAG TPA: response regulator transcription factor [Actinomycetota bacterium]